MKIRFKLLLTYLFILAILLILFGIVIFFESEKFRQEEIQIRLRQESLRASTIFFEKNEISPELFKLLDKNNFTSLTDEEVIIFNDKNQIIYESGKDVLKNTNDVLSIIAANKEYFWSDGAKEMFGQQFERMEKKYITISSAIDKYGIIKQRKLAKLLFFGGLFIYFLSVVCGWLLINRMLHPIKLMIQKIDNIKGSKLNVRLDLGNENDEFWQLSSRFNQMLERLEHAFQTQRAFVSNASHELRTPLTSITGQIQVSLLAGDSPADLKLMIGSVLEDVQQLNKLSNNLLKLTSIESDNQNLNLSLVNLLDKISRISEELRRTIPGCKVFISLDEKDENIPELRGNPELLYSLFFNLIENGIKYSTNNCAHVLISILQDGISVLIENKSSNLSLDDISNIFKPFVRGANAKTTRGHGIGLSLSKRISELHHGSVEISKKQDDVILVSVFLPILH